jgi:hypothetical protein
MAISESIDRRAMPGPVATIAQRRQCRADRRSDPKHDRSPGGMNDSESPRPTPRPLAPGRATSGLAAGIAVVSVVFIILLAAPSPRTQGEPTPEPRAETFTAVDPFVASSPSAAPAAATASGPTAPIHSAAPVVSPSPVVDPTHVATRIRIPDLHIDLAVVAPPKDPRAYPKCGVAMYLGDLDQPGEDGATYVYAHARAGMFLPIYERAIQRLHGGPRSMLGLFVEVFTSDNLRYRYAIQEVRVHQTSLRDAVRAKTPELWLQTSEGPKGTRGKTQLRALPIGVDAATDRQAHPAAKPVTCG